MFLNLCISHTKMLFRDKDTMFWTAIFPLILGTLFHFAFSNLMDSELFEHIPIAVVDGEASTDMFSETDLFDIHYVSEDTAARMLEDGEISGYVLYGTEPSLVVKESGYEATIIKAYMDSWQRISATMSRIIQETGQRVDPETVLDLLQQQGYTSPDNRHSFPDYSTNFFFTLMAMTCMYAGQAGVRIARILQADQSPVAARTNLAPASRTKLFFGSYLPAVTVQCLINVLVYLFTHYILGVNFGPDHGLVILTGLIGTITGTTLGAVIGLLLKVSESLKFSIVLGISMTGSFLAGMMSTDVKYLVQLHVPILARLNPVNLITDSYYSLYYYDTYTRYTRNIVSLCILCIICFGLIIVSMRRQRYEAV